MNSRRFVVPSTRSLIAFEAAARLGGVMRASRELNTSPSSISRHIRNLEASIGRKLFQPLGRDLILTDLGKDYFIAVQSALSSLHIAGNRLGVKQDSVLIGCDQEIATSVVQPALEKMKKSVGDDVSIRVIIGDYDTLPLLMPIGIDITLNILTGSSEPGSVKILDEEIAAACAPDFLKQYGRTLAKHPRNWGGVPRLERLEYNSGWATWSTWFEAHDCATPDAPVEELETKESAMNAARQGSGVVLVWKGFVGAELENRELALVRDGWLKTGTAIYARLTEFGANKAAARNCVRALGRLSQRQERNAERNAQFRDDGGRTWPREPIALSRWGSRRMPTRSARFARDWPGAPSRYDVRNIGRRFRRLRQGLRPRSYSSTSAARASRKRSARELRAVCAFDTHLVAIGTTDNADFVRSLIRNGIQDYLLKPVSSVFIRETVEALQSDAGERAYAGRVLAFVGSSGCGTSTLVAAIARSLAADDQEIAVVDAGSGGREAPGSPRSGTGRRARRPSRHARSERHGQRGTIPPGTGRNRRVSRCRRCECGGKDSALQLRLFRPCAEGPISVSGRVPAATPGEIGPTWCWPAAQRIPTSGWR